MFCTNCGKHLTEAVSVCPHCGARIDPPQARAEAEPVQAHEAEPPQAPPEAIEAEPSEPPRKNRALLFGALGLLFGIAALAFALIALPRLKTPLQYKKAVALLDAGDYEGAQAILASLGDYADADALSETAARGIAYREAVELMERGDYSAARDAFRADPEFEDAAARIEECDRALCVGDAKQLMEAGAYAEALERLEAARESEETDALILTCRRALTEQTCTELMERGAYAEALDLLGSEDGALLSDRDARVEECENRITYHAAEEALSEGRRADAYKLFLALGDWSDAQSRVQDCLSARPVTCELYHDRAYTQGDLVLTVRPPSDGADTFFRIFAIVKDQPIRVADLFIRAGDAASVNLPEGTYLFKSAYGFEWFGEPDLFGDGGVYQRLRSSETSDLFALEKGFEYTLVLRSEDGGNVDAVDEPPEDF